MRLSRRGSARPSFIRFFAAFLLFSSALGQNPPPLPDIDQTTNAPATTGDATSRDGTTQPTPGSSAPSNSASNTATSARPGTTSGSSAASTSDSNTQSSESASESESATSSGDASTSESGSTSPRSSATITPTGTPTISGSTQSAPRITGSGSSAGSLSSGLPTLRGQYPPPTVPPTAGAPFMQQSTLPEGTVFIVVGAILGFLGFSVLAWRGLVAWSVHRSVRRAAREQNMTDAKVMLRPRGNGLYAPGPGSTLSLDRLSHNPRASSYGRKAGHASNGSLFFSPTARAVSMVDPTTSRPSSYLPGGYYPAANATPAGGAGTVHLGTPGSSHNQSRRSRGPSPPVSPSLSPSRHVDPGYTRSAQVGAPSQASTSSLNLSVPPQGRAPSAYLEDLFESHQSQPTRTTHERY